MGEIAKGITPLGSRMLVSTQKGYQGTSYAYNPSQSDNLLKELGFKKARAATSSPTTGRRRASP